MKWLRKVLLLGLWLWKRAEPPKDAPLLPNARFDHGFAIMRRWRGVSPTSDLVVIKVIWDKSKVNEELVRLANLNPDYEYFCQVVRVERQSCQKS